MKTLINRYVLSMAAAIVISSLSGFAAGTAVIQTLFSVLGVAYSLSMGSAVNFDMAEVMNKSFRSAFTSQIKGIMRWNTIDFAIAAAVFTAAVSFPEASVELPPAALSLGNFAAFSLILALVHVSYSFWSLFKLSSNLSERIYEEKREKQRRKLIKSIKPL